MSVHSIAALLGRVLAAALIVIAAFASFTLYNDYLQRNAIRQDLDNYLQEMGTDTAKNIHTWLAGRSLLIENLSQSVALNPDIGNVANLLEQKAVTSSFMVAYLRNKNGSFLIRRMRTLCPVQSVTLWKSGRSTNERDFPVPN